MVIFVGSGFAPCNPELAVSGVMDQLPPRLKLLQHAFHGCAYLSFFVGSGLILLRERRIALPGGLKIAS